MQKYPIWTLRHNRDSDSIAGGSAEPLVDVVLANRGLTAGDIADSPGVLQDPYSMKDMDRLTDRIVKAVRAGEQIVVFGDYDVDGVTSTAVFMDFLERAGADVTSILPDRHRDGYGMKPPGVQRAIEAGARLIVTADNGISSFEAVEAANAAGVDVLVTDHHQPQGRMPDAYAVVNPNRPDCDYAFKGLAAVGVAFKAVQALSDSLIDATERRAYLNSLLDLVALGTVADIAPMLGENRLLTRRGMQILDRTQRPGLQALKAVAGADTRPVDTTAIGFFLGPRINSAGRLASADLALDLLRTSEAGEAARLAERLNGLNRKRRELELEGVKQAEEQVESMSLDAHHRILVAKGDKWHLGVVGLIAGRLAERYGKPGIACTEVRGDGSFTGSARSVAGYNIAEAIFRCADLLTEYGGHADAAGFTGNLENFDPFKARLEADAAERISDEDLRTRLELDAALRSGEISLDTVSALSALAPFGAGNEAPLFMVRNCTIDRAIAVGKGAHLKMNLDTETSVDGGGAPRTGRRNYDAVWWGQGELAGRLQRGDRVDVACALEANTWNGRTQVQLVLEDMRPAEE